MDGPSVNSQGRFLHRFGFGGVGMADQGDILGAGTQLHGGRGLCDHVTSLGTYDMDAENPVAVLVRQDFHKAVGCKIGLGAAVGGIWLSPD